MARKLYMRQGMGVGLFRTQYGGRNKRRGSKPEFQSKASGGFGCPDHRRQASNGLGWAQLSGQR